jgi:dipeptidyl aminopeptidase/acylaminoacyl peptidase
MLSRTLVLSLLVGATTAIAADGGRPRDGSILSSAPCRAVPKTTYDEYVGSREKWVAEERAAAEAEGHSYPTDVPILTREQFEARVKNDARIDCRRLTYASDGLEVVAYAWRPKGSEDQKLPLIIFNRGGNRTLATVGPSHWVSRLTHEGFAVVASQYRGADGGEGKDEFGGADVRDVLNLFPLARALGNVDMKNVFMLGWSRGGMMTALALKHGADVNAAALGSPLTNLLDEAERRPRLAQRVWSESIPDFATRRDEVLRERSAVFWPEKLRVPLLILQGGADWRVDPAVTLEFASALQRSGARYELIVYADDDHSLNVHADESRRKIVDWFREHMHEPSP